ncbi:hypothetical protein O6H91_Y098800 [Diphasiastrum complanatum]|nr:hypothetical protein O6H91_Y098800 [Diphasiastrum complanatum]
MAMAISAVADFDLIALNLQTQDFQLAHLACSDSDLAFELQLNEALAASMGVPAEALPGDAPVKKNEGGADDLVLALEIQSRELKRAEQEVQDAARAKLELHQLNEKIKQRVHDSQFAQTLSEMPDEEWEEYGDEYENPFQSGRSEADKMLFELHFKGLSSSRGEFPDVKFVGIGVVVLDAKRQVVSEVSKHLDGSLAGIVAEYTALIEGLSIARSLGARRVHAFGESKVVYKQIVGVWSVRSRKMLKLWEQAMVHIKALDHFELSLSGKEEVELPKKLAKEAIISFISGKEYTTSGSVKDQQCSICLDDKDGSEMFTVSSCCHKFCRSCVVRHAEVKIKASQVPVLCPEPNCATTFTVEECEQFLPSKTFDLLSKRLMESSIPEAERMYCPFRNCSALMRRGNTDFSQLASSSRNVRPSTGPVNCVECERLFCAECRVPWHKYKTCDEYQKLPPELRDAEDVKLHQLAENKNWKRCKECRCMIELAEGCFHMTCRCGYEFCYVCGAPWKNKEATCKCKLWDEHNLIREPLLESDDDTYDDDDDDDDDDDFDDDDFHSFVSPPRNPEHSFFWKTKVCMYWERGNCRNGNYCNFAHGANDLR